MKRIKLCGSRGLESALAELDGVLDEMDAGGESLEESLRSFVRGTALLRYCQEALERAEARVVDAQWADGERRREDRTGEHPGEGGRGEEGAGRDDGVPGERVDGHPTQVQHGRTRPASGAAK